MIIVPSVVSHTKLLNRAVVQLKGDGLVIQDISDNTVSTSAISSKRNGYTLSEVEFYERFSEKHPQDTDWLKMFIDKTENLGVKADFKRSLIMRFSVNGETEFGLGYIQTGGQFYPDQALWELEKIGLKDLGLLYIQHLCDLLPNATIKETKNGSPVIVNNDKALLITDLKNKEAEFLNIIKNHIAKVAKAIA